MAFLAQFLVLCFQTCNKGRKRQSTFLKSVPHQEGDVARAAGHVEDLGVLVLAGGQGKELLHQGLRVAVPHDRLALVEVF